MKAVVAYVKPHMLADVTRALRALDGLTGMSVIKVHGFGRGRIDVEDEPREEHMKIEVFCRDDLMETLVTTIERAAHTGLRGDGKICVWDVSVAVRISTGERGNAAV